MYVIYFAAAFDSVPSCADASPAFSTFNPDLCTLCSDLWTLHGDQCKLCMLSFYEPLQVATRIADTVVVTDYTLRW